MIGQLISHYRVLEKLGEGGMGVVYRARDTRLDRDVALKFLPQHLITHEPERARFLQEARAASALNHPNICTIHDVLEHDRHMFIVMDFVEGQTVRDLVGAIHGADPAKGGESPLPVKRVLDLGIQVAEGLAAAHEKGIVHRDIKPENIMVRKDGIVQIMDFGLAKLRGNVSRLTKEGSTVGTAGYMSPEQVQGQDADHRSDIFSFGVLLYELLTGQVPFRGVHETALAYEIVNVDPAPISSIRLDIDPALDAIILECLEKDPRERTQSMAQVALDLKKYRRESSRQRASRVTAARPIARSATADRSEATPPVGVRGSTFVPWILAALFFSGMAGLAVLYILRPSADTRTVRSHILPPENLTFAAAPGGLGEGHLALSPDGTMLAVVVTDSSGKTRLFVRGLESLRAKELPGTEGASYPFWSPDSRTIGFFQPGRVKKIDASGGPSVTICPASDGRGGSWNQDGTVIFSQNAIGPLYRVPSTGGVPLAVTVLDTGQREQTHRWPQFLPDGRHFLYFSRSSFGGVEREEDALFVASLDGKVKKRIMSVKGNAAFASGCLIYLRESTLMAQPFDADGLETRGDAIPIADPVRFDLGFNRAVFAVSQTGVLVYQGAAASGANQLEWFDRAGKSLGTIADPANYSTLALSPDGERIAFSIYDAQGRNMDLWLFEIWRGVETRFTFDPAVDDLPVWSPDGSRILFHSDRNGHYDLYQKTASGGGVEELLLGSPDLKFPTDWSPDGRFIAYATYTTTNASDLWVLPLAGDRAPARLTDTEFEEYCPQFSPDMRYIAYQSNESGRWELYVRPFLDGRDRPTTPETRKWQVSPGGIAPTTNIKWGRDGKELFYLSGDNTMTAVDVRTSGPSFEAGAVHRLFEMRGDVPAFFQDVSADGRRFLFIIGVGGESGSSLTLVMNWDAGLKAK